MNKQNPGICYSRTLRSPGGNRHRLSLQLQPCRLTLFLFPTYPTLVQVSLELRAFSKANSSVPIHGSLSLPRDLLLILTRNQKSWASITCLWAISLDSSYTTVPSHLTPAAGPSSGLLRRCCLCSQRPVHPAVLTKTGRVQGAFPEPQNMQDPTLKGSYITLEMPLWLLS